VKANLKNNKTDTFIGNCYNSENNFNNNKIDINEEPIEIIRNDKIDISDNQNNLKNNKIEISENKLDISENMNENPFLIIEKQEYPDQIDEAILTQPKNDLEECSQLNLNYEYKSYFAFGFKKSAFKNYCFEEYKREFAFQSLVILEKNEKIESFSLIKRGKVFNYEQNSSDIFIYCCRIILVLAIFVYMLYQIAVFLIGIFYSYGNQFYLVSLIPAAIMLVMNFFVINLLMILLSTIIMYRLGLENMTKDFSFSKILYWIAVPSQANAIYLSVMSFKELYAKHLKKNKI